LGPSAGAGARTSASRRPPGSVQSALGAFVSWRLGPSARAGARVSASRRPPGLSSPSLAPSRLGGSALPREPTTDNPIRRILSRHHTSCAIWRMGWDDPCCARPCATFLESNTR
jgi:hypothetical protein